MTGSSTASGAPLDQQRQACTWLQPRHAVAAEESPTQRDQLSCGCREQLHHRCVETHLRRRRETAILLQPPLPSVGVSIGMERGCRQNDNRTSLGTVRQSCEEDAPSELAATFCARVGACELFHTHGRPRAGGPGRVLRASHYPSHHQHATVDYVQGVVLWQPQTVSAGSWR